MVTHTELAFVLFQAATLLIPALLHVIGLLSATGDVNWRLQQVMILIAFASVICFLLAGGAIVTYAWQVLALPTFLVVAVGLVELAMLPFAVYVPVLYVNGRIVALN